MIIKMVNSVKRTFYFFKIWEGILLISASTSSRKGRISRGSVVVKKNENYCLREKKNVCARVFMNL